jgi:hypothetical protein
LLKNAEFAARLFEVGTPTAFISAEMSMDGASTWTFGTGSVGEVRRE